MSSLHGTDFRGWAQAQAAGLPRRWAMQRPGTAPGLDRRELAGRVEAPGRSPERLPAARKPAPGGKGGGGSASRPGGEPDA